MNTIKSGKGIEALIEGAIARGEFENLKGRGKPLNLDTYFDTPEHLRLGHSLLRSAGFLPEELELRAEINLLEEKCRASRDEGERRALRMATQDKSLKLNLLLERFHRRARRK